MDRVYKWIDGRIFGRVCMAAFPELQTQAAQARLSIKVGGHDLEQVEQGVRRFLRSGSALPIEIAHAGCTVPFLRADIWIDHRSLSRSVTGVAKKMPAILAAARQRLSDAQDGHQPQNLLALVHPIKKRPAVSLLFRLIRDAILASFTREQWVLCLAAAKPQVEQDSKKLIRPPIDRFWADPFIASVGGRDWVVFEELVFANNVGRLCALQLSATGDPVGEPLVIMKQPYHLSYPFCFRAEGQLYMIPESSANRSVDLYVNEGEIDRWRKVSTLLQGERIADASVIHFEGLWWMFATRADAGASMHDELHVFWAERLEGPWQAHTQNPVKIDAKSARPAGTMWIEEGCIHRPVQDCSRIYGGDVRIQRVEVLSKTTFLEFDLGSVTMQGVRNGLGFHTLSSLGDLRSIDMLRRIRRM